MSDQRDDRIIQVAEVFLAAAKPVPDVIDADVTIGVFFELALNLEVFIGVLKVSSRGATSAKKRRIALN